MGRYAISNPIVPSHRPPIPCYLINRCDPDGKRSYAVDADDPDIRIFKRAADARRLAVQLALEVGDEFEVVDLDAPKPVCADGCATHKPGEGTPKGRRKNG